MPMPLQADYSAVPSTLASKDTKDSSVSVMGLQISGRRQMTIQDSDLELVLAQLVVHSRVC